MLYVAVTRAQKTLRLNATLTDVLSITNSMENIYVEPASSVAIGLGQEDKTCFHCQAPVQTDSFDVVYRIEQIGQTAAKAAAEIRLSCPRYDAAVCVILCLHACSQLREDRVWRSLFSNASRNGYERFACFEVVHRW